MCFRFLQVMWRYLKTGYVPHQGHGVEYQIEEAAAEAARAPLGEPVR
jgi:hypothetical protein